MEFNDSRHQLLDLSLLGLDYQELLALQIELSFP
jgi:hypothetical protein